jgi:dimethylhistidine N-methyltransferase
VFLDEILAGLAQPSKQLPCKYFYDEAGARLFEQIGELPEYYPTRCELAILERSVGEMVQRFGPDCAIIEYGSGSGRKTRLLLEQVGSGVYYPVDLSSDYLQGTADRLRREYPQIEVVPVCADFSKPFSLPRATSRIARRIVYFSGSTISNFGPPEAIVLLRQIADLVGPGGGLLIGVDLKKSKAILEPAYDDAAGVTAAFNLNLLTRINRELDGDFVLDRFRHWAFYNETMGRIEMHLVSLADQEVRVANRRFRLRVGETICTEYSYKFSLDDFAGLARSAEMQVEEVWTDADNLFSVQYAQVIG